MFPAPYSMVAESRRPRGLEARLRLAAAAAVGAAAATSTVDAVAVSDDSGEAVVLRVVNWGTRPARITANLNGAGAGASGPAPAPTPLRAVNITLLAGVSGAPDETNLPWDPNRVAAR